MTDHRLYARYLSYMLAAAACLFLLPVAVSELLKIRFGELKPPEVIERQLQSQDVLYLSGLDQDVAAYKLELARAVNPAVIAIGSSRALQIRDFFFTEPFVNWGLAVRSVGQLEWATRQVAALPKKPKLVLVLLDPWWFNGSFQSGKDVYVLHQQELSNIYRTAYVLGKSFVSGKLPSTDKRLGLAALRSNQGFDHYGSFHYVARVTGHENHDFRFESTLQRVDARSHRFAGADEPNPLALKRWRDARSELERAGVQVVEIMPPFASPVVDRMRSSGHHGYIGKISALLGGRVLDYTDPRVLPDISDCEFVDGFHAGEVVYAKLLLDAAKRRADLRPMLNIERLRSWSAANRGLASPTTISLYADGAREVDFLRLGCMKQHPQ